MRAMRWWVAVALVGSAAATGEAAETDNAAPLSYRYELVQSADDAVCGHMREVYNTRFRQPWNVAAEFEARLESLKSSYFGNASGLSAEQQREILWTMRFDVVPTSAEFEAVHWRAARLYRSGSRDEPDPARLAIVDLNNDGQPDLVLQNLFYGTYEEPEENLGEQTMVYSSLAIMSARRLMIEVEELESWGRTGFFSGHIVRPFIFNGTTYLSRYQRAYNDDDGPPYVYHPESILIERYHGGPTITKPLDMETVCEFRVVSNKR